MMLLLLLSLLLSPLLLLLLLLQLWLMLLLSPLLRLLLLLTSVCRSVHVLGPSSAHILMVVSREPVMMPISPTATLRTCRAFQEQHPTQTLHVG
jgi:hypothetical protein